ncbi:MAG: serine endopeptidase [Burkholderiales bacterium]|nr:serine endopeptidase [Burkholderiales bacterium]
MSKSLRVRERLFRFVLWIVAVLFAAFLTGLGGLVIGDLPRLEDNLSTEQFIDKAAAEPLREASKRLQSEQNQLADQRERAGLAYTAAVNAYRSARDSLNNWISTRRATEQSAQDPELLQRTRELDDLKATERARQTELEALDARMTANRQALRANSQQLFELQRAAQERFERASFHQELRVFGLRLALTLPLLLLAGWLFVKKRHGTYWPFVWGFIFFAAFAFFVELVPYLPSYGGYVRYVVGIVLTLLAGTYLIRAMQRYLAQKQAEQTQPQTDRRDQIRYEQALEHMRKGVCPSCERSVRFGNDGDPDFCMHCGLLLFERCHACSTRHNAFFHFCPACGARPVRGHGQSPPAAAGANEPALRPGETSA